MILTGLCRLGRDAELRRTTQGEAVATLSLAFNHGRKGQDNRRPTQWVEAALWGQRAEGLAAYLLKGTTLSVVLEDPHIETFERQDRTTGSKLVARVTSVEFAASGDTRPAAPPPAPAPRPAPRQAAAAPRHATTGTGFDDMDDDIPF